MGGAEVLGLEIRGEGLEIGLFIRSVTLYSISDDDICVTVEAFDELQQSVAGTAVFWNACDPSCDDSQTAEARAQECGRTVG